MTSAEQTRIERRCGQRFPYQISVFLRLPDDGHSGTGFTQDLSSRGALLWTDFPLTEGQMVEVSFVMPSEITLAEDMTVCCRARVLRLNYAEGNRPAVAVKIEHYDFPHREAPVGHEHSPTPIQPART